MREKNKKQKVVDRRIQKTRKLLSDSLIALILEKGYEAVTIQNIIDRANVGRSTFYAHFENKEQLLLGGHQTFRELLETDPLAKQRSKNMDLNLLHLYKHAGENLQLAKALLGKKGGNIVTEHLREVMSHKILENLGKQRSKSRTGQKMFSFTADAAASAMVSLLTNWLENEMPFTPEEMAKTSDELLDAFLKRIRLYESGT